MALRSLAVVNKYQSLLPESDSPSAHHKPPHTHSNSSEESRAIIANSYNWTAVLGHGRAMTDLAAELIYKRDSLFQQFLEGRSVTLVLKGAEGTGKTQFLVSHTETDTILRVNSLVDLMMRELAYQNGRRKQKTVTESVDLAQIPPSEKKFMIMLGVGEFRYSERAHTESFTDLLITDQDHPYGKPVGSPSRLTSVLIQSYDEFSNAFQSALLCSLNFHLSN